MSVKLKLFFALAILLGVNSLLLGKSDSSIVKNFAVKPLKIIVKESNPPLATVNIAADKSTFSKLYWALIEVQFDTDKANIYVDDVQMDMEVALFNERVNKIEQVSLFTGKIDYWNVELDGKTHYVMGIIPAKVFKRYAENNVTPTSAELRVSVKFTQKGKLLAEGYYAQPKKLSEATIKDWFSKIRRARNYNVTTVPNSILARRDTSWGVIEVDKYELEKKK